MNKFKIRKWQKQAFKKIDEYVEHPLLINACVGSGKTIVACYALGKFIVDNKNDKTVQMFVTPRIRLCDQQNNEIETFIESEFGLKNGQDYKIIGVDCSKHQFNKKNDLLVAKHSIFVICDESLWGKDKGPDPASRWHSWIRKFKKWEEAGFKFGWAALDEAHNYEKNVCLMLNNEDSCLADWFRLMPMSGTPSSFQREWSKKWLNNVCSCSPKVAMENGWICKPTLNLVLGDKERGWAKAIAAVLHREIAICKKEVFKPRIMVNCSGIDDIKQLVELKWMQKHAGKEFHLITLHSTKGYDDGDGVIAFAKPTIDCKVVEADDAYAAIEAIDSNSWFNDDLPIIVAQVAMLGEGINVSSFNAILTASNAEKTAMQQIGRCIRNYWFNGHEKVTEGHANVYVLTDNVMSIKQLLINLEEFDLTDECFQWGDKIDIMTGSGLNDDNDSQVPELNTFTWDPIDPEHDLDIVEMMQSMKSKLYKRAAAEIYSEFIGDRDDDGKADVEELEDLLANLSSRGLTKLWSGHSFKKNEMAIERKAQVAEAKAVKKNPNGVKTLLAKRSNPVYDIFMAWLFDIRHAVKTSESVKKLWNINRLLCIETILQNKEVAKFLVDHMNTKKLESIVK